MTPTLRAAAGVARRGVFSEHVSRAIEWEQRIAAGIRARSTFAPTARSGFDRALSAAQEVEWYHRRVLGGRPPAARRIVQELAEGVTLRLDTRLVVAIPVFAREQHVERSLATYLDSAQDLSATTFLLFVNAWSQTCSPTDFTRHVSRIRRALQRIAVRSQHELCGHVIALHSKHRLTMGAIRATMHDVLVEAAIRSGHGEFVVLFNDADQLAIAPSTFARVKATFSAEALVDLVCMPVSHGYDAEGTSFLGDQPLAPELLLGVRYNHCAWLTTKFDQAPLEWLLESDGGAFAVRLASLCAVGGFDGERAQGEDNAIALKVKAFRRIADRPDAMSRPPPPYLQFDADSGVVSDPRRLLNAIVHGQTANHAWRWQPFAENLGTSFSVRRLLRQYSRRAELLQASDLRGIDCREPPALLLSRVLFNIFRPPFRNPLVRTSEGYRQVANRFGLRIERIAVDDDGRIRELAIDVARSPIFELLQDWASAA